MKLNIHLLKTIGFSWLAFLLIGVLINICFPIPTVTVLIDRSYCPASQWQQVSQAYSKLYRQHRWQQLHLQTVVLFSDLGQEVFSSPPSPDVIQNLTTYGQFDGRRQAELQKVYSKIKNLGCYSRKIQ